MSGNVLDVEHNMKSIANENRDIDNGHPCFYPFIIDILSEVKFIQVYMLDTCKE